MCEPTVGGFVLAFAPWQVLFLVNVPVAALAFIGIRRGVPADKADGLHRDPIDGAGALLGTATIVLALVAPTLFVDAGTASPLPWLTTAVAIAIAVLFVVRERAARHPLLDLKLLARPLVPSGLAFKAAAGLATAGLGYLVTLQLQLDWGWTPTRRRWESCRRSTCSSPAVLSSVRWSRASVSARPPGSAPELSCAGSPPTGCWAASVMCGSPLRSCSSPAGMRVVGVVAGTNVMRGLPADRATIGRWWTPPAKSPGIIRARVAGNATLSPAADADGE
jgi:hypothetical protein